MDSAEFFAEHLDTIPVLAIFRGYGPEQTVRACLRAWDSGVRLVEVPVQTPDALPSLRAALRVARERGHHVGAGTVTTAEQLTEVADLGVAFTVAPGLHPEVLAGSRRLGLPHLPGVATATEIAGALAGGARWVKAFPAKQLGADWIAAQLAPFPSVRFVATGGIDTDNAAEFLAAGCRAVALGSALSDPDTLPKLRAAINA